MKNIIFGTWGMSGDSYGPIDTNEINKSIDTFLNLGGTIFETASSYGMKRQSELILAANLKSRNYPFGTKPKVISKIGNLPHIGQDMPQKWDKTFLIDQIKIADEIFGELLDGILLHSPPVNINISEILGILSENLRVNGKKIGIALRTVSDLDNANVIEAICDYKPDIISLNFSLMDQRLNFLKNLDIIKRNVVEIWARTVFNFGFLVNPNLKINHKFDHRNTWSIQQIEKWRAGGVLYNNLAKQYGFSPTEFAIGFCLNNKYIDRVCLGMINKDEVVLNMTCESVKIPDKLIQDARKLYNSNTFFLKTSN